MKRNLLTSTLVLLFITGLAGVTIARFAPGLELKSDNRDQSSFTPAHCCAEHNVGKIVLQVNNNGTLGSGFDRCNAVDCFTGKGINSCEYPKYSGADYLFAASFWIGAVVGNDTTVSLGCDGWSLTTEMFPDESPFGEMQFRSIIDPSQPEYEDAVSEQDYIAVYTDTITEGIDPDYFGKPHSPLYIEVTQNSYAWSYAYAEDFVLFDYRIENIGSDILQDVYMGIYVDGDVGTVGSDQRAQDDICGFLQSWTNDYGGCSFIDTTFIAWIADADGDFAEVETGPALGVTGTRIVRTPAESLQVSFNWWISDAAAWDFGPRHRENFRDYRTGGLGTPMGDVNKYAMMKNGEFDYDQVFTLTIGPLDSIWLYPIQEVASRTAKGDDTRYLLSFGPFQIHPGQSLPISFAYVGGENFHQDPNNAKQFLPDDPESYYANLNFEDLATNSTWASWIYDNPGVDTDGDGDSGKFHICCNDSSISRIDTLSEDPLVTDTLWDNAVCDTFWYEGDGVPDFLGASPPPAPTLWVYPEEGKLRIRWNGFRSETTRDVFSKLEDFEGYRVYLGRDIRAASYSMIASYDIEDYNRYVWNPDHRPYADFDLIDIPFTIDSLRILYGDTANDMAFEPLAYTRNHPFVHPDFPDDSIFYFEIMDYNVNQLGGNNPIRKIYPLDTIPPTASSPEFAEDSELTEDGYFKYYEYECTIDNLQPSVPYYVNVTAFDFGSPESGLASLETSVTVGYKTTFAQANWDEIQRQDLKVYCYPNPYRIDANYRERGLEGREEQDRPSDRTRELHFANLPPKCTIRLYTLDGDLVREFEHDKEPSEDGTHMHDSWNLITRNTQRIVSGLYYWTVETPSGEVQIGKFVVLM
ncbi:MAG TPA: hypothetical protein PLF13_07255 [candidate division Zixibacteria bacterium]|nr:hypothetical protein [candidate division Zixibacteria bacterium]